MLERTFADGGDWNLAVVNQDVCFAFENEFIGAPRALSFKSDGTKLFALSPNDSTIYEYALAVAWDAGTITFTASYDFSAIATISRGMTFNADGTTIIISAQGADATPTLYELTLSTAWDITSATDSTNTFSLASDISQVLGIDLNSTGLKLYAVTTDDGGRVLQLTLTSDADLSTMSYTGESLNASQQVKEGDQSVLPSTQTDITNLRGIYVRDAGTQLFLTDWHNEATAQVHEYAMGTIDDITTAVFKSTLDIGTEEIHALSFRETSA